MRYIFLKITYIIFVGHLWHFVWIHPGFRQGKVDFELVKKYILLPITTFANSSRCSSIASNRVPRNYAGKRKRPAKKDVPTSPLCNYTCNLPRNITCTHRHYTHHGKTRKKKYRKKRTQFYPRFSISACYRRLKERNCWLVEISKRIRKE